MKTSKKILLTVAGILIALLITSMLVLRQDAQWAMVQAGLDKFTSVPVGEFDELDFSANWQVSIRQGRVHKVELLDSISSSQIRNVDGKLHFFSQADPEGKPGRVRITMPFLRQVSAVGGSEIHLKRFHSDSLRVILQDSVTFIGEELVFEHVDYETSGKVKLRFKDDPME